MKEGKEETLLEFSNRVYGLHVSEELDALRNRFCPSNGKCRCDTKCPIHRRFICRGFSCNQALDQYPDECRKLITEAEKA